MGRWASYLATEKELVTWMTHFASVQQQVRHLRANPPQRWPELIGKLLDGAERLQAKGEPQVLIDKIERDKTRSRDEERKRRQRADVER